MNRRLIRFFVYIFFLSDCVFAAPYPATSSSVFLDNKTNIFLWPYHIDINLSETPYELDLSQNDSEKWSILTSDREIQVFVRVKQLGPKEDYDKSLKNWVREYEKSGFQIVAQQIPKKNAERGWIHLHDTQEKHLIQNFRFQNRTWVYLNCVGKKEKISLLKETCEKLSSVVQFR